jgi:quaternary ammonium compound-resistance protein SugE
MSWIILFIAGLLEVVWAIGLKYTHGFTRLTPSVITVTAMIVSIVLLSWAMRSLPVGTAYAVWTGIGAWGPPSPAFCCWESQRVWRVSPASP